MDSVKDDMTRKELLNAEMAINGKVSKKVNDVDNLAFSKVNCGLMVQFP